MHDEMTSGGKTIKQVMQEGIQAMEAANAKHGAELNRTEKTHMDEVEKIKKKHQSSMETLKTEVRAMVKRLATELEETQSQRQAESEKVAVLRKELAEARESEAFWKAQAEERAVQATPAAALASVAQQKQPTEPPAEKPFDLFEDSPMPSSQEATQEIVSTVEEEKKDGVGVVSTSAVHASSSRVSLSATAGSSSVQDLAAAFSLPSSKRSPLATGGTDQFVVSSEQQQTTTHSAAARESVTLNTLDGTVQSMSAAFKVSDRGMSTPENAPTFGGGIQVFDGLGAQVMPMKEATPETPSESIAETNTRLSESLQNVQGTLQARSAAFAGGGQVSSANTPTKAKAASSEVIRHSETLENVQGTLQARSAAFRGTAAANANANAAPSATDVGEAVEAARNSVTLQNLEGTVQARSAAFSGGPQVLGDDKKDDGIRGSVSIPNGPSGTRSEAMKKKEEEFRGRLRTDKEGGSPSGGGGEGEVKGPSVSAASAAAAPLATVYIISNDARLAPFGPVIE
jgi:hypothetical protein